MPTQNFALDAAGAHRITVFWNTPDEPAHVLLNGSMLGMFPTEAERITGRDFTLPDGSPLHVRFVQQGMPQVFRNSQPLFPAAPPQEVLSTEVRKRGGCLTTWLVVNLIFASGLFILYGLGFLGSLVAPNPVVPPYAFVLFSLLAVIAIAGLVLMLFWKKWGFYLIVIQVVLNLIFSFIFDASNAPRSFFPFIGLVVLYRYMNKNNLWDQFE